jgi:hypothetical protein
MWIDSFAHQTSIAYERGLRPYTRGQIYSLYLDAGESPVQSGIPNVSIASSAAGTSTGSLLAFWINRVICHSGWSEAIRRSSAWVHRPILLICAELTCKFNAEVSHRP